MWREPARRRTRRRARQLLRPRRPLPADGRVPDRPGRHPRPRADHGRAVPAPHRRVAGRVPRRLPPGPRPPARPPGSARRTASVPQPAATGGRTTGFLPRRQVIECHSHSRTRTRHTARTTGPVDRVAIIGMAGRFPGAGDVGDFLARTSNRAVRASPSSPARNWPPPASTRRSWPATATSRPRACWRTPTCSTPASSATAPREAELIDPQHRVFLECAWEALETAGYDPAALRRAHRRLRRRRAEHLPAVQPACATSSVAATRPACTR